MLELNYILNVYSYRNEVNVIINYNDGRFYYFLLCRYFQLHPGVTCRYFP
jgi:hypothetical protein